MNVPLNAFLLFFVVFATVVSIVLAKVRADKRSAAKGVPEARVTGGRRPLRDRFLGPGGYLLGFGLSAVLSAITCAILAYIASRPTPPERHTYQIYNVATGQTEIRELTEQELHEQYESVGEGLARMYREHHQDAGTPDPEEDPSRWIEAATGSAR